MCSTFLALDLGGTNLRVCEVTLQGNNKFSLRQQKYKVSTELKTGEAKALFGESISALRLDSDRLDSFKRSPSLLNRLHGR